MSEPQSEERRRAPKRPHPLERPEQRHPLEQSDPPPAGESSPPAGAAPRVSLARAAPTLTQAALVIMIVLFALRALSPTLDRQIQAAGWNLPQAVFQEGELYRLFSSIFLHASIWIERWRGNASLNPIGALHLLFNAYMLFHFGGALERILGHGRFALLFLLGGLSGSVLSALTGNPCVPSLGASGAVFALIGAQLILLARNRRLFGRRGAAMLRQLLLWTLLNFGIGLASTLPGSAFRIDNWAHFGGLAAGLALAWAIIPRFRAQLTETATGWRFEARAQPLPRTYAAIPAAFFASLALVFLWRWLTLAPVVCPF